MTTKVSKARWVRKVGRSEFSRITDEVKGRGRV